MVLITGIQVVGGNNRNTYSRRSGSNRSFGQRQNTGNFNNNSSWGSRSNSGFSNSSGNFGGGSFRGGGRSGGGSFGGGGGHCWWRQLRRKKIN